MLVSPPPSVGEVYGFKISTGEEIIAKIVDQTETTFTLSKPLTLMPSQQGMAMIQTLIGANTDKNVILQKSFVIFQYPVIPQLEKHYIETTSGICLTSAI